MRHTFLLIAAIFGFSLAAQEGPKISSAVIAADRQDLAEAKKYIDEAAQIIGTKNLSEVRSKDLAKFYYYQGLINFRLTQSSDEAIKALDPQALDKATEGFRNLIEYENQIGKERYTDNAKQQLPYLANAYASRGIEASGKEDYAAAFMDFQRTYDLKKDFGIGTDTSMLYNASLMAQQAGNNAKAIEINEQLIAMNYKGVQFKATQIPDSTVQEFSSKKQMEMAVKSGKFINPVVEGDLRPNLYITAASLNKKEGDTARYEELVTEGRAKFPENETLLILELQKYLDVKDYDKALENLNAAIALDPSNSIMYYNKGVILQNEMSMEDEALKAYEDALEIDPDYSDALYMTSIIYLDQANEVGKKMNELPLNAKTKYEALKKEQTQIFEKALPYLEKAHKSNPEDTQVTTALGQVYRALKMYEKAQGLLAE